MTLGRPRAFDIDKALDCALKVFWRKGYEGASLPDLTKAMGINRPSLYAAFGNKEGLFRKALDRYAEGPTAFRREALDKTTAREVVERLLSGTVDLLTDSCNPCGCLAVQWGSPSPAARRPIPFGWNSISPSPRPRRKFAKKRLERAKSAGDLPADSDPADLARYITVVIEGMAVHAAGGASRDDLQRIVQIALRAWPA